jgi:peptidoglycan hydrolase-like protein with peptidoglycan-binding domain
LVQDTIRRSVALQTAVKLLGPPVSTKPSIGNQANLVDQIRGVQTALKAKGFYSGPIDGIDGRNTTAAIRKFQQSQGLPVTGLPDDATLAKLSPTASNT